MPSEVARTYHYVRVSTDKQANSPEAQRESLAAWQRRMPEAPPPGAVIEDQVSAWKVRLFLRPGGSQLLRLLNPGDWLVAVRLDRLVRNQIEAARLLEFLETRKIKLHLVDGQGLVDASNPYARLMYAIQAGIGEIERSLISERTRAVLRMKRDQHLAVNPDGPRYGYEVKDDGRDARGRPINQRAVACQEEMAIRHMIWGWHTKLGLSPGEIKDLLNEHGILRRGKRWADIKSVRAVLNDESELHGIELYRLGKHIKACNNRDKIVAHYALAESAV